MAKRGDLARILISSTPMSPPVSVHWRKLKLANHESRSYFVSFCVQAPGSNYPLPTPPLGLYRIELFPLPVLCGRYCNTGLSGENTLLRNSVSDEGGAADGSTHTESNRLYRNVKHRARPNPSSRQHPKRAPIRRRLRRRQRRGKPHTEHGLGVLLAYY